MAERADVVFVDGVRTPFGRAGEKGMYWNTRADDLAVKAIIGLLERNPDVPKDRIDDVAIAATTQTGDQGLTLGRTAAILAGPAADRAGLRDRPHVRGRHDRRHHHGAGDRLRHVRRRHRRRRRAHGPPPDGANADPNPRFLAEKLVDPDALNMGATAERIHDRFPAAHQGAQRPLRHAAASRRCRPPTTPGKIQPDLVPVAIRTDGGLGPRHRGRGPSARDHDGGPRRRSRPRSARTAASPRATRRRSPTARPRRSSPAAAPSKELGLAPKMKLVCFAFAGVQPEIMGIGPIPSTEKALKKAGLTIDDIGLFELNEAFADPGALASSTTSASPTTTRASTSGAARSRSATRSPPPACAS